MFWRRFPWVRQDDQSDCGAACLATIHLFFGGHVSLLRLRDIAGTDRAGVNLAGLQAAAEKLGYVPTAVRGDYEALSQVPLPAIAHFRSDQGLGHFVVLYRAGRRSVWISDPAQGRVKMTREEFEQAWTGYLLLLSPNSQSVPRDGSPATGEPSSDPSWRRLVRLIAGQRGLLIEAAVCAVFMTLLGIGASYFVRHLVDSVLVRGESQLLNALGIGMIIITFIQICFSTVRQYLLAHLGRKLDLILVSAYTRHVLSLPMRFFEMRRVGDIASRINDSDKIREAVSGVTLTTLVDGLLVLLTASFLWFADFQLATVAMLFVPVILGIVMVHHVAAKLRSREAMEAGAAFSAHIIEDISGVETIKAFNARRLRLFESDRRLVKLAQSSFGLQALGISMNSLSGLVGGVSGIVILWFGGHRVISGAMTIGELMFFHTLLGNMLGPVSRLASVNIQFQEALIATDRMDQIMDLPSESHDEGADFKGVTRDLTFRGVSFQYGCREPVLRNIDLTIDAGKTVAIVGESGCGKSTLLKLLMRFHDATKGSIAIDGVDIRDFNLESLRSRIGIVSQDPFIFNGTVRENIAIGSPTAEMTDIVAAARAAGLEDVIAQMPDRYDTVLGERGANLSGGQRQRLAIARAVIQQPDLLLFDEATSHLDTNTERTIQQNLQTVFRERTVVVVAHRLSTIRSADQILVMHHGQIVERGTHDELLAQDGKYSQLWRSQSVEDSADKSGCNARRNATFERSSARNTSSRLTASPS